LIRHTCSQHVFRTEGGKQLQITVSIGIAQNIDTISSEISETAPVNNHNQASYQVISKEEILACSDSMLQIAKKTGRDKIMVAW